MDKFKKNIGLDTFRSHFPGLLPFIGDNSGKTFPVSDDKNGNFGKIVLDLVNPFNIENCLTNYFLYARESFKRVENGVEKFIYSYVEMSDRYFSLCESFRKSVVLKKVNKKNESIFVISDDLSKDAIKELMIYDPVELGYFDIGLISGIGNGNSVPIEGRAASGIEDEYILVIQNSEDFKNDGGFVFIELFEKICGILEVPSEIKGVSVPSFISLYNVQEYYDWLLSTRTVKNERIQEQRYEVGGDDMMFFLKEHLTDLDNILSASHSFSKNLAIPEMSIPIPLSKTGEEIGLKTIIQDLSDEEQSLITDQFYSDHPDFTDITKEPIKAFGESELFTLMYTKRDFADPDSGEEELMLPGIFKSSQFGKDEVIIVKRASNPKDWEYETKPFDKFGNINYDVVPTFGALSQVTGSTSDGKRYIVKYNNGVYYNPITEDKKERYILRKKDSSEFYEVSGDEYVRLDYIDYQGDTIPNGDINENSVYYLNNNVFDGSILLFELGTYIRFNSRDKVWRKYILPSKEVFGLTQDDYVKIRYPFNGIGSDETRFYATDHHFEYVQISDNGTDNFYKAEYVPADIPFLKFDGTRANVYDKREASNGVLIGSYIIDIAYDRNFVYFKYVISGEPFGNQKEGIFFNERYLIEKNKSKQVKIDGYNIEYIYNEIDYKSKISDFVKEEWGGISRKTIQSEIEYNGNDFWHKSDFDIKPSIKNETYANQIMMNDPEINITFDRGNASAFERYFKLMECNTFEDLKNYGNDFFGLRNETPLK